MRITALLLCAFTISLNVNAQRVAERELKGDDTRLLRNTINTTLQAELFPNPASGFANLQFRGTQVEETSIKLYGPLGNTMRELNFTSEVGINQLMLPVSDLDNGTYLVTVQSGELSITKQLIVAH